MQHGKRNRDDAFNVMQDYLSRYDQIDAVWADDDGMAIGMLEVIAQAGREEEMWVLGGAGMKEIIARVRDGARLRVEHADVGAVHHRQPSRDARECRAILFPRQPVLGLRNECRRPDMSGRHAGACAVPGPRGLRGGVTL